MTHINDPLHLGIVGMGEFGRYTTEIFAEMPEVQVAGISSRDANKRAQAAAKFHARAYETFEEMLADSAIDAVILNTPPFLHGPQGLAAIQAGKHVFAEKPLATSLADAQAIIDAASEQGMQCVVDYVQRFVPINQMMERILAAGLLGEVNVITFENYAANESLHDRHWFWDGTQSGGIFVEHGVHFFDLGAHLTSSAVQRVTGFARPDAHARSARMLASVEYVQGTVATYYHAFDRPEELEWTQMHVTCANGSLRAFGWIPTQLEVEGIVTQEQHEQLKDILGVPLTTREVLPPPGVPGGTPGTLITAKVQLGKKDAVYRQAVRDCLVDFVAAIRDPTHMPRVTLADAYASLEVALAAQASADEENRVVAIETQIQPVEQQRS
jgi:predicted dehydrogenase